jgi:choice-of-anchor B domain-containing protein
VLYRRVNSVHNIVINEESGFAYAVGASSGGETCGGGLHMIDIREPKNPQFAGCFSDPQTGRASTGYSHDAQCVMYRGPDERYSGREICLGANETALSIADVTDKANPQALSRASYPNVAYSHQGWLTRTTATST